MSPVYCSANTDTPHSHYTQFLQSHLICKFLDSGRNTEHLDNFQHRSLPDPAALSSLVQSYDSCFAYKRSQVQILHEPLTEIALLLSVNCYSFPSVQISIYLISWRSCFFCKIFLYTFEYILNKETESEVSHESPCYCYILKSEVCVVLFRLSFSLVVCGAPPLHPSLLSSLFTSLHLHLFSFPTLSLARLYCLLLREGQYVRMI